MRILAIETSCDETAAAVIENGRRILSNVVATQIELHERFGGVFPEVASRQHVLAIRPVIEQALEQAGISAMGALDALAVTNGPGLAGSLLVGVNTAKGISFTSGLPLLAVNHLEGHIYSNWLAEGTAAQPITGEPLDPDRFPILVLIVSGGHTELALMTGHSRYQQLGSTLDDAAGEAFDKVARLLELGYPGGPAIQRAAGQGDPTRYALPRPLLHNRDHRFNFSFSGLKTAALNLTRGLTEGDEPITEQMKADVAAAFQAAAVEVLVEKTADAAQAFSAQQVCICGGVSANAALRQAAATRMAQLDLPLHVPPPFLCTDNAAMIGAAAYYRSRAFPHSEAELDLDVFANLPLVELQAAA
ncbi:MAG: tRNA (adenosine(37)-N6)-threonylcarbamoyltransferase complex transferase subunit TsaD [Caldilineaceae bacterium]|nr:tRNA (adenosine(37)-N6)-threonylcarbamoyltransferase complex transferase subunit TsaD [Caldilineaceae bacterium]